MIKTTFTVCVKCKNLEDTQQHILWGKLCKAKPREASFSPLDGTACFKGKNDLGGVYYTDEPYEACCQINTKGNCELFVSVKTKTTKSKDNIVECFSKALFPPKPCA